MNSDQRGFTLLEVLMALVIIAILAAVGITQFVNYNNIARDAATRANLQVLRTALGKQYANLTMNCQDSGYAWPAYAAFVANDISDTVGAYAGTVDGGTTGLCKVADIDASSVAFVNSMLPVNPWGSQITTQAGGVGNKIYDCTAAGGTGGNTLNTAKTAYIPTAVATYAVNTNVCYPASNLDCSIAATTLQSKFAAVAPTGDGWCYDYTSGKLWANSASNENSPGTPLVAGTVYGTENEY